MNDVQILKNAFFLGNCSDKWPFYENIYTLIIRIGGANQNYYTEIHHILK